MGRWGCNDDKVDATPEQKLTRDKTRLDGLAKPHVVGNQQIDARKAQGFPQGELSSPRIAAGAVVRLHVTGLRVISGMS